MHESTAVAVNGFLIAKELRCDSASIRNDIGAWTPHWHAVAAERIRPDFRDEAFLCEVEVISAVDS